MTDISFFRSSTQLFFGPGASLKVGEIVSSCGINRIFVVSDPGVKASGITDRIRAILDGSGVETEVFDEVEPNPSLDLLEQAAPIYQNSDCEGLIAIGGGSSIDLAKSIGIVATNPGTLLDYVGIDRVINPLPPLFVVPTTVGSGSEVTRYAVITDKIQRKKLVLGSQYISPLFAFIDPDVVELLPSKLIASTSMDALTHAIESVISNFASPFSDGPALEAIWLIKTHLSSAYRSHNKIAKANLLYASTLAGIAFNYARTGLVHGMSHPLSSYYGVPHGLANAILLPYVLEFNSPQCRSALARVAAVMGTAAKHEAAIDSVRSLAIQVDIPSKLSEVGVTESFLPEMAKDAYESGNARLVNPRQPSYQEILDLYYRAL